MVLNLRENPISTPHRPINQSSVHFLICISRKSHETQREFSRFQTTVDVIEPRPLYYSPSYPFTISDECIDIPITRRTRFILEMITPFIQLYREKRISVLPTATVACHISLYFLFIFLNFQTPRKGPGVRNFNESVVPNLSKRMCFQPRFTLLSHTSLYSPSSN